jgi:outer membrane protein, multidrug efflux system
MTRRRLGIFLLGATALSGCAVGPNYRTPEIAAPSAWNGVRPADADTPPAGPTSQPAEVESWWETLHDPVLTSLLARALASNLDLRMADARVRAARAQSGAVAADLWPQVDLTSAYRYSGTSANVKSKSGDGANLSCQARGAAIESVADALLAGEGLSAASFSKDVLDEVASNIFDNGCDESDEPDSRGRNLFQVGFDASWEIDLFGGRRRSLEAATAEVAAAEERRHDVRVTLLSEVAFHYVQLRGFQRRLAIARENIEVQRNTLELTQTRYQAGFTSRLDVAQARTQLATTRSHVPMLVAAIQQSIFQIGFLLGLEPGSLLEELNQEGTIPQAPAAIPVGLPSDLLRRRPDIRWTERQLAAATARIGEATADLFPRCSLTGSFGPESRSINRLLDGSSLTWGIGPSIRWPILDGWRIRSNIAVQNALQEQALASYEKAVLRAFQDVENALTAYTNEQARRQELVEAVDASQQARDLSNELYTQGQAAFLNVLEAQRALYASQDALVQSETTAITNLIALYKALGGGWQPPDETGAGSDRPQ